MASRVNSITSGSQDCRCSICKDLRRGAFDPDCPRCLIKARWMRNVQEMTNKQRMPMCGSQLCSGTCDLEEDTDNPGTFYCGECWSEWEHDQAEHEKRLQQQRELLPKKEERRWTKVPADQPLSSVDDFEFFEDPAPNKPQEQVQVQTSKNDNAIGQQSTEHRDAKASSQSEDTRQFGVVLSEQPCAENDDSSSESELSDAGRSEEVARLNRPTSLNCLKRGRHVDKAPLKPHNQNGLTCHGKSMSMSMGLLDDTYCAFTDGAKQQKNAARLSPRSPPRDENVFVFPPAVTNFTPEKQAASSLNSNLKPKACASVNAMKMAVAVNSMNGMRCGHLQYLTHNRPPPGFAPAPEVAAVSSVDVVKCRY